MNAWLKSLTGKTLFVLMVGATHGSAFGFYIDGNGQYSLRGETRTNPGFHPFGTYQAAQQSFNLHGEVRANDRTSFFMNMRLFPNQRLNYAGDSGRPMECSKSMGAAQAGTEDQCSGLHQDPIEPGYEPYLPRITEAYIKHAFEYCLLTVGRRGRDWGMGLLFDSGREPFAESYSVFDGVTCDINIQKSQTLGFSIGYDKLAETGRSIAPDFDYSRGGAQFGPHEANDDLEQFFLTIEFDNRQANAGTGFSRNIGIYFANVLGNRGKTDIKLVDIYSGFYFGNISFQNELIFRLGKSVAPSFGQLGGAISQADENSSEIEQVENDVQSIGLAGELTYTLSQSGALVGPTEFNQGNLVRHSLFLGYAYAPGDAEGYKAPYADDPNNPDATQINRERSAKAMAFHRNYKPGMILFNEIPQLDDRLRVDGVYNPGRVMNATVFSLGYRYESSQYGNFETKLISAKLNEVMPQSIRDEEDPLDERRIGYAGANLGSELNLMYDRQFGRDVHVGGALGMAIPGDAWKIQENQSPRSSFALQTYVSFFF